MNNIKDILLITRSDKIYLLLIWLLFISVEPFQFYAIIPYHPYKWLVFFIATIFFLVLVLKRVRFSIDTIITVIIIQLVYTFLTAFIHFISLENFAFEDSLIYFNLFLQLVVILITYIFTIKTISIHKLSISWIRVMVVMSFLGMLSVFLIYFFNLQPISYTIRPDVREISNFGITFATGIKNDNFLSIVRSSGYFDEPGSFAFYITVALLLNKLYGFSKSAEKYLIIFGFCTLSLGFMISIFCYIIIFGIIEKRIKFVSTIVGVILLLVIFIDKYKQENEFMRQSYELTMYRLQSDDNNDDKFINGDNRSENLSYSYQAFLNAPFFGHGMNAHVNTKNKFYGKLCCNPLHPLATDGLIGTLIYFLLFIIWGFYLFRHGSIDLVSTGAWVIIFINLLQRPGFLAGPFGYFVFIFLFEATKWRKNQFMSQMKPSPSLPSTLVELAK